MISNLAPFLGRKILYVTAHPDDESYLCSGTMVKNYECGGKNILICATDGEAGVAHLSKPLSPRALRKLRRQELVRVSKLLKVKKLYPLGLPDGQLRKLGSLILKKILQITRSEKPEYLLSFGPDGITGHYDHIAICRAAHKVAKKYKIPCAQFAFSPKMARHASRFLIKRRHAPHYLDKVSHNKANLRVPIDAQVKLRALACHRSQLDRGSAFRHYPDYARREILAADYFRVPENNLH